jgi:hypothetical protein
MSKKVATLSLGTREDAKTWNQGCERLGFTVVSSVRKSNPTDAELDSVFGSDAEWLYLGGHFGSYTLSNEAGDLELKFQNDRIKVYRDNKWARDIEKGSGFKLNKSCWVVLWGGCNVCTGNESVRTMHKLFDEHVLLGFSGLTGWAMVNAMLGGGFIKAKHFFNNVQRGTDDPIAVRNAWMEAARAGYGGGSLEDRFRAFDYDMQEWKLKDGKIVKGRDL